MSEILVEKVNEPIGTKPVVAVIGRFQPPTTAHYAVISAAKKFAHSRKDVGFDPLVRVIVVAGEKTGLDKRRNPLTAAERVKFMQASGHANGVVYYVAKTAFEGLVALRKEGLEPIAIAAGSDRATAYKKLLDDYFMDGDKKVVHHTVQIDRAPDSDAEADEEVVKSMHATGTVDRTLVSGGMARLAAELGYKDEFMKIVGLEDKPVLGDRLYQAVLSGVGEKKDVD